MIAWMSKGIVDTVAQLVAQKEINAKLEAALAAEKARVDWFMQHVNELKVERAALYERLGVHLPVPTIERVGPVHYPSAAPLPGMDDNYVPPAGGQPADLGNILATARDVRERAEQARRQPPMDLPFQGFDDIGDEAAAAIGAKHDGTGRVIYER